MRLLFACGSARWQNSSELKLYYLGVLEVDFGCVLGEMELFDEDQKYFTGREIFDEVVVRRR